MKQDSSNFFEKIKTSKNLPSLPQILLKLIEICNREGSSVKEISQVIDKDSSISARVLKMVNSAYYGLSNRVTNIDQALVLLGTDAVKNISISASVNRAFSRTKDNSGFDLKAFWKHSLLCATLAKKIAIRASYPSPDEAFLSGLLHDIGKLVLLENFPKEYAEILKSSKNQWDLTISNEAQHGATHCEVGAWLIGNWNLQSFMADAVLYHHESVDRINDALLLVKIIYVANILCPEIEKEYEVKLGITENIFRFSKPVVEEMISQANQEVKEIAKSLDIEIESPGASDGTRTGGDDETEQDLIREIKDLSLLQGTLQNLLETQGEDSILKVVQQGLDILFDLREVFFFLYDDEKNILLGKIARADKRVELIKEVNIPFKEGKSLLVSCLLQDTPMDSFIDPGKTHLTIIDEQIIRLTGNEGIFCLPFLAHRQPIGVVVFGLDKAGVSHVSSYMRLLKMFARQVSLALHANHVRQNLAKRIQSERLTASSEIARKVVHEVNTPLSIIKNYITILKGRLADAEIPVDELDIINEEIDRVSTIVHELSDFSESKAPTITSLDINALLTQLLKIFRESNLLASNIHTHMDSDSSIPFVHTDKNMLKQVLINLIQNAVEVMPGGGNIFIGTRYVLNDSGADLQKKGSGDWGWVEITIRDDGPGIPDTLKTRLFDPFVTSKGAGHAGLGLSIVFNAVKELKGTINYKSDRAGGTCFTITLPVTHDQS